MCMQYVFKNIYSMEGDSPLQKPGGSPAAVCRCATSKIGNSLWEDISYKYLILSPLWGINN